MRFPVATVAAGLARTASQSSATVASSVSGGATRFTRPRARAVSASMNSPVKSISNACLRGTLRLKGTLGVEQNRPWSMPLTAIRASVLATARSQVARSWQPAAVASPLTLATTGWGRPTMLSIMRLQRSNRASWNAWSRCACISFRSCPAQNARPAPVRTTTLTEGSAAMRSSASWRAAIIDPDRGLRRSGRLRIRVATPPSAASISSGPVSFISPPFLAGPGCRPADSAPE